MSLFAELKRRRVFQVATACLALAWVMVEVTATVAPALQLPAWTLPAVIWTGVFGFPCVLDAYRTTLMFHAGMPQLRNDPRFPNLCSRLGLVEFWLATGKWPDCADQVPYDFRAEREKARDVPKQEFGF